MPIDALVIAKVAGCLMTFEIAVERLRPLRERPATYEFAGLKLLHFGGKRS